MKVRILIAVSMLVLLAPASAASAGPCESKACRSQFVVKRTLSHWRSAQVFADFRGSVKLYVRGRRLRSSRAADGCGLTYRGHRVRARLRYCANRAPLRIAYRGSPGIRVLVVYRSLGPRVPVGTDEPPSEPTTQPPPEPTTQPDPPAPPDDPPREPAPMYWGGTIDGAVYGQPEADAPLSQATWDRFEADAGKRVTFVNFGQGWGDFDRAPFEAARARGAIPLVTMPLPADITLEKVAAGRQDRVITAWAQAAKAWGYPFLFRPWWEVNGDWYPWGRDPDYVAAWRHFHDLVVAEGATNVTWAWVTNTLWVDPESNPAPYYPGDDYVDWVGMDAYNWGENPLQPDRWTTPAETIEPTLQVLKLIAPGKPICICELASTEIGGEKAPWITELLTNYLPSHPEIKAFLWFNWNIEQEGGFWDWPIESTPAAQAAFNSGIQAANYLSTTPPMTPLSKVPVP